MTGNCHVRFLGEGVAATSPPYPTKKTPTLRNVDRRAPYMHDGSEATLDQVVRFYNRGGDIQRASLDIHVRPLSLSDSEIKALCDFMHTLTSDDPAITLPVLPQ